MYQFIRDKKISNLFILFQVFNFHEGLGGGWHMMLTSEDFHFTYRQTSSKHPYQIIENVHKL